MWTDKIIVLKFGSSILHCDGAASDAVAEIYRHLRRGWRVVAIVSAIGETTDELLDRISRWDDVPGEATTTMLATGELASASILTAALRSKTLDDSVVSAQLAPKLMELARQGRDLQLWNLAAYAATNSSPEDVLQLERDGWKATSDPAFAAGVLFLKREQGELASDDLDLAEAMKQFPESSAIHRIAYEVAVTENKVDRTLLANAARAEFTHFSSFAAPGTVVDRPRSGYLRSYFGQLHRIRDMKEP